MMMCVVGLIGCGGTKVITKVEYVCSKVEVPEEPRYEKVQWVKVCDMYCLDLVEVKKLLKNYEILQSYKEELKIQLRSVCEGGK